MIVNLHGLCLWQVVAETQFLALNEAPARCEETPREEEGPRVIPTPPGPAPTHSHSHQKEHREDQRLQLLVRTDTLISHTHSPHTVYNPVTDSYTDTHTSCWRLGWNGIVNWTSAVSKPTAEHWVLAKPVMILWLLVVWRMSLSMHEDKPSVHAMDRQWWETRSGHRSSAFFKLSILSSCGCVVTVEDAPTSPTIKLLCSFSQLNWVNSPSALCGDAMLK